MRPLQVSPSPPARSDGSFEDASYDAVIAALGYETRARRISRSWSTGAAAKVAIAFSDHTDRDDYRGERGLLRVGRLPR